MIPHGQYSKYSNDRCHCDPCRTAWAEYQAKLRAQRRSGPIPASVEHGKPNTYNNWGCKCPPCTDAHNLANKMYRARRRTAKMAAALLES